MLTTTGLGQAQTRIVFVSKFSRVIIPFLAAGVYPKMRRIRAEQACLANGHFMRQNCQKSMLGSSGFRIAGFAALSRNHGRRTISKPLKG